MLMMNDEGSEDGGFIWGGLSRDGRPMNFSHLSFDQYDQDQTLSLDASFENGEHFAGVRLNDLFGLLLGRGETSACKSP
jgi:hypothetical protein